jgi:hypothetical protein
MRDVRAPQANWVPWRSLSKLIAVSFSFKDERNVLVSAPAIAVSFVLKDARNVLASLSSTGSAKVGTKSAKIDTIAGRVETMLTVKMWGCENVRMWCIHGVVSSSIYILHEILEPFATAQRFQSWDTLQPRANHMMV